MGRGLECYTAAGCTCKQLALTAARMFILVVIGSIGATPNSKQIVARLAIQQVFGDIMIDYSYVECSSSAMQAGSTVFWHQLWLLLGFV